MVGVIEAVGEDEGVSELVAETDEVPEGVSVPVTDGVGESELDSESVGV